MCDDRNPTSATHDVIKVPVVSVPHPGASYNPPVQAHEELLVEAYKVEQRRQEEADRLLEAREKINRARAFAVNAVTEGVPAGMDIDEIKDDGETIANTTVIVSGD
jgi:nucleolar protein 53